MYLKSKDTTEKGVKDSIVFLKEYIIDEYFNKFNYEIYGGTPILGLNKTVIIGHGISNEIAIKNMIIHTKNVVDANLSEKIKQNIT